MANDTAELRSELKAIRARLDEIDAKLGRDEEPTSNEDIANDRPKRQNFGFYKKG